MNSNNTRQRGPIADHPGRGSDAQSAHVVLVADSDPAVTDDVAGLLRDNYTVRTAYTSETVLPSIDEDVSVVLLDPTLPGLSVETVVERLASGDVDSRIAALSEEATADDRFDDLVRKPVSPDSLRSTVDRLCHCVAYRSTLERFYALARERATLSTDDPQRDHLDERLAELEAELDETVAPLDTGDAYEAALREPGRNQ